MRRVLAFACLASLAAGCAGPVAPDNGVVEVVNEALDQTTFAWNTPGPFGNVLFPATGQDIIDGCSIYARSFGTGVTTVTIWHGSRSLSLVLALTKEDQDQRRYVVVNPDGAVTEVDEASLPAQPCPTP